MPAHYHPGDSSPCCKDHPPSHRETSDRKRLEQIAMEMKGIDLGEVPELILRRETELRTALSEKQAEIERWKKDEHDLSDAYLRIRKMLDAFDTPTAPTGEQVWKHTEAKLASLTAQVEVLRGALEAVWEKIELIGDTALTDKVQATLAALEHEEEGRQSNG